MRPPRLAQWILRHSLPFRDRAAILGDLAEEFQARRRAGQPAAPWYWRQMLALLSLAVLRFINLGPVLSDVRFTFRHWRRQPAFAAAAIGTQAIGIAVATAVLAVAHAVLLRPLPYADPERLVHLLEGTGRSGDFSFQDFMDVRRASRAFDGIAGYSGGSRTLTLPGASPDRLPVVAVTDGFFEVLGVTPVLGRSFTSVDVLRGSPGVVILSHDTWTGRFGADRSVLGRAVALNGIPHEIIGVLPRPFSFPLRGQPELWLPLRPSVQQEERGYMHWMSALGRPRTGLSPAQVQSDLDAVASLLAARDPRNHADARLRSIPLRDMMVASIRPTLHALLAGVGLLLLVTCATTATLLLSRAAPRRRELSIRAALGASRGRVVLQLLCENVLLSIAGGTLGVVAGHWLIRFFAAGVPPQQRATLPHFEDPGVNAAVAAAAVALSVATGLLFGVVPAWRAARLDHRDTFRTGRATAGAGELRLRSGLVSLQMAVAVVLLGGAALLATSVQRLMSVPPTFDPEGLVTMRLNLPPKYQTPESVRAFHRHLLEQLESSGEISAAATINQAPLTGRGNNGDLHIAGRPPVAGQRAPVVSIRTVSRNYFDMMKVPLWRGRQFAPTDTARASQVVLINRLLAETVFAGTDPLGQRISFQFLPGDWQVIGIVANERFDDIDRPLLPVVYFTAEQDSAGSFTLMLRAGDTAGGVAAARRIVGRLDPELPVFGVRTIEQLTLESPAVFLRRSTLWMLGVFAVASVVLAAMGLYGVLAQSVADRTREIGVRVALGATRARITALVARAAMVPIVAGTLVGVGGSLAASRWLSSLVFGVSPRDPLTLAGATMFLLITAVAACFIPAMRALRVDPASAVRVD